MKKAISSMILSVLLFVAAILFLSSCISMDDGPPPTPAETFLTARMVFNGLLSDYVDQKGMADAATKARWTEELDPWFERGARALNAWGTALKAGEDSNTQKQAYLSLKNQLMAVILRELTATH